VEDVEEMKEMDDAGDMKELEEIAAAERMVVKSASQQPDVQDPTRVDEMGA